jgi:hypothetical protein
VREFYGVNAAFGTYNVRYVGDGSSSCGSEVEYLGAWFDPYVVYTTQNGGSD